MEVGFGYGCLSAPLEEQANSQGFTLGKNKEYLQECVNALNTLRFDFLNDSQKQSITKKIHTKVIKSLKPLNKPEGKSV